MLAALSLLWIIKQLEGWHQLAFHSFFFHFKYFRSRSRNLATQSLILHIEMMHLCMIITWNFSNSTRPGQQKIILKSVAPNLHPQWPVLESVCVQTLRGQNTPASLCLTVPLPYMYTWSGYVNFDMWVSISSIFTMGFIRPWLVFWANLDVKRKTPRAVCKPTLRVPLLGTAYLQGSCLFC